MSLGSVARPGVGMRRQCQLVVAATGRSGAGRIRACGRRTRRSPSQGQTTCRASGASAPGESQRASLPSSTRNNDHARQHRRLRRSRRRNRASYPGVGSRRTRHHLISALGGVPSESLATPTSVCLLPAAGHVGLAYASCTGSRSTVDAKSCRIVECYLFEFRCRIGREPWAPWHQHWVRSAPTSTW